ncbi:MULTISPECIES: PadR family transcriptional regulator [unclassified Curtobacterium]|uniref:PadR family transcriptional regulator n=1 Tax=unclassified Curtobacterium TaxID=257496 RepID=UPI000DA96830|nr:MULTISPECIES: helix-turn-helix transcriptional regulator [unclassified Curtobacterium]PZE24971.1 PadR family transcriptional regulator [Curtobacterium sp. MCBD17_028]PZE73626.1 PadR family transcriptional regulator [Curtobacterium sp. MCBD17_019]PZF56841.1 PadR family transcriptional regulator [Curtobacterium sp. MCBD17_034]PZF60641.1 PadR family transcriptional regulator [Curtobacterium sp. MCBD17_013]PZM33797.1 PadR family transcriptional regulator [Curtobacterium sp. MCBD17_031]
MEPLQRVTAPTLDVLQALLAQEEPLWGLVLIKTTGRPSGTVYPILERLERQGWITGSWDDDPDRSGPRRRRYAFTGEGRVAARDLVASADEHRARAAARPSRRTAPGRTVTP